MDGIHDLGGRLGFGPIDVHEPEEQFHHDWEERTLAIIRAMTRPIPWSIDWFRYVRELIEPVDYLSRPYYDQWLQTYAAMMIDAGAASVEEFAAGQSLTAPRAGMPAPMAPRDVAAATTRLSRFERAIDAEPAFAVSDRVRAKRESATGHTRLPGYARGRTGTVEAVRGAFVFPDTNMTDDGPAKSLYTVRFAATELWPEAAGRPDSVFVDLWESYLERA
ncbi:MAG: nitrile hydratase subunit beta [Bauldia sp.]